MFKPRSQDSSRGPKGWTVQDIILVFMVLVGLAGIQSLITWQSLTIADLIKVKGAREVPATEPAATAVTQLPSVVRKNAYFDPPRTRDDLGAMLESRSARVGVELGVQRGHFALGTLRNWKSCSRYYLVDIWRHQPNYEDFANVPQAEQDKLYLETQNNLQEFKTKVVFYRNFTSEAAKVITEPLDYVYVDARHDYCGAMEDISLYWPKLKSGGIMAGHDYLDADEANQFSGQHWEKCMDSSVHPGAVRGAVNEFFQKLNVPVYVTYKDSPWNSWLVVKP